MKFERGEGEGGLEDYWGDKKKKSLKESTNIESVIHIQTILKFDLEIFFLKKAVFLL